MTKRPEVLPLTYRRHLSALPLWVLRAFAQRGQSLWPLIITIVLDVALVVLHYRANRISEERNSSFGRYSSWTKVLYAPELIATVYVVLDARRFVQYLGR
jgi:hypothetical protein